MKETAFIREERLEVLKSYEVLDTPREADFDDLVALAAKLCETNRSALSLIDTNRQWFKASLGMKDTETSLENSICKDAMLATDLLIIKDLAADERFLGSSLLTGEDKIRFYAGAPLVSPEGAPLGALCVLGDMPGDLTESQKEGLRLLGKAAQARLEQHRYMVRLKKSEEKFENVFHNAPIGMVVLEEITLKGSLQEELIFKAVNLQYAQMTKKNIKELEGKALKEVLPLKRYQDAKMLVKEVLAGGRVTGRETKITHEKGVTWLRYNAGKVPNTRQVLVQVENVTEMRKAVEDLEKSARSDALTGLPNRRAVKEYLQNLKESDKRHALFFLDLDKFKVVNDSWGHEAGDLLLQEIAKRIKNTLRGNDFGARLGGDEFVVCCSDLSAEKEEAEKDASEIAKRINNALKKPITIQNRKVEVTSSIGIALGEVGEKGSTLLADADAAMYRSKKDGRARSTVFDNALREDLQKKAQLELALVGAIKRQEMRVLYQPVVQLKDQKVVGHEALLRWNHKGKEISPDVFIPLAEENGLINEIGTWVLGEALKDLKDYKERNSLEKDYALAVNVSPLQVLREDFVATVKEALLKNNISPGMLALELTEDSNLGKDQDSKNNLALLRGLGVQIGVDDFGTGYSSLTYLQNLPTSFVKIDRSFIANMTKRAADSAIVAAVINLATALELKVVAEGVETVEQANMLLDMKCELAQGWLYGRPGALA